jgi:hypothetical protein
MALLQEWGAKEWTRCLERSILPACLLFFRLKPFSSGDFKYRRKRRASHKHLPPLFLYTFTDTPKL